MARKYLSAFGALVLLFAGCGEDQPQPQSQQETPQASQQEDQLTTSLSETTLKRAIKSEDLVEEVRDGRLIIDGATLHMELPGDFSRQETKIPGRIGQWGSANQDRRAVLSVVGTAGVAPDAEKYAEYLRAAPSLAGMDVEYLGDVEFGEISAHHFRITGADAFVELFSCEFDGISYELTVKATDQAGIDQMRDFALATRVSPKDKRDLNGSAGSGDVVRSESTTQNYYEDDAPSLPRTGGSVENSEQSISPQPAVPDSQEAEVEQPLPAQPAPPATPPAPPADGNEEPNNPGEGAE
ncbi:hypothetical protein [Arcanobacterium buesumense]|uniref:Uncharacterized protein n=1 Tax=Arcanobacterium buesumense TaxID=2722751 RepID=A0A6H2EJG7_9ACTO|nr:hypothetical protein [Arcanobacterium buesumense]QJC21476.1 hypothetical protein HC352_02390 [Arcanobacterium buesumense]